MNFWQICIFVSLFYFSISQRATTIEHTVRVRGEEEETVWHPRDEILNLSHNSSGACQVDECYEDCKQYRDCMLVMKKSYCCIPEKCREKCNTT
uniref:Uncharacterized protein n=1 Tax=Acrobeloides nanus TaxID=290746 RepID=A0A914CIA8_9BILA